MTSARELAAHFGWRLRFVPGLGRSSTVVLMYHGIPAVPDRRNMCAATFERHISFLKDHFNFITPAELEEAAPGGQTRILLTFDDGFRNNVEQAAPILLRNRVPAVFFVATRHLEPGRYLWFTYLHALEAHYDADRLHFRGVNYDTCGLNRAASMAALKQRLLGLRPHPAEMYDTIEGELPKLEDFVPQAALRDHYAGMTADQLSSLAAEKLFSIGGHTIDHPFLTKCDPPEAIRQMRDGASQLEAITQKPCRLFAYPGVDYDAQTMAACRDCGFQIGFSAERRIADGRKFEWPRTGIYYPHLTELGFKVRWSGFLRRLHQWQTVHEI